MLHPLRAVLTLVLLCLLVQPAPAVIPVPSYNAQHKEVTDLTGTLTPEQTAALVQKIRALEQSDGSQLAVLMVPTTEGEAVFDLAQRTATEWGVGTKANSNGILFVIAKNDRKDHIHVGYGLEGRLTDALASRILRNEVHPSFKEGRFYEGIDRGITAMIEAIRGEYQAAQTKGEGGGGGEVGFWVIITILVLIFLANMRGGGGRGGRRGRRRSGIGGFPIFYGGGGGGGWTGGSSGGGWSGGGGAGGGGFGGGSFGGGGASGSW